MEIIKKEVIKFSKNEIEALQLVTQMCIGLMREAEHPELRRLAQTTYDKVSELWGWGEEEMEEL
jgi:hypothetical protein